MLAPWSVLDTHEVPGASRLISVNGRFLTQKIQGAQRYAHEVTRRLLCMRGADEVRILMPRHPSPVPREFAGAARQVGRLRGHLWEQAELGSLAGENGLLWSPIGVGPIRAKRQVVTIHDVIHFQFPRWFGRKFRLWYSFVQSRLATSSRHIITVSEYSKATIIETLGVPEEKVSVVYHGVDDRFDIPAEADLERVRRKYDLPETFIMTLSALEPRKNLDRTVDAWLRLDRKERPPLIIAGGLGSSRVYASYDADSLRRHEDIRLTGYIPDEDLPALYGAASVFVYASLVEGFGLPPLEAMACGSTVVVSDTSAMKETHGGLAFTVDPESTESISDAIAKALDDTRGPERRREQSQEIKHRFDWAKTAQKTESILGRYE